MICEGFIIFEPEVVEEIFKYSVIIANSPFESMFWPCFRLHLRTLPLIPHFSHRSMSPTKAPLDAETKATHRQEALQRYALKYVLQSAHSQELTL